MTAANVLARPAPLTLAGAHGTEPPTRVASRSATAARVLNLLHRPIFIACARARARQLLAPDFVYTLSYLWVDRRGAPPPRPVQALLVAVRALDVVVLVVAAYCSAPFPWSAFVVLTAILIGSMFSFRRHPVSVLWISLGVVGGQWSVSVWTGARDHQFKQVAFGIAALACAGALAAMSRREPMRRGLARVDPLTFALTAGSAFCVTWCFCFFHTSTSDVAALSLVPGVRILWRGSDDDLRREIVFVTDACDGRSFFVGLRERNGARSALLEVSAEGSVARRFDEIGDIGDNAVVDCEAGRVYVGDVSRDLLNVFDVTDISKSVAAIRVSDRGARRLILDAARGIVISRSENFGSEVEIVDVHTLEVKQVLHRIPSFGMGWLSGGRLVGVLSSAMSISSVLPDGALSPGAVVRAGPCSGPLPDPRVNLATDPVSDRVFVACSATGEVVRMSGDGLATERKVVLERGLRYLTFSPVHSALVVGTYLGESVWVLDARTLRTTRQIVVGDRIRWIEMSRDGRRALVPSHDAAVSIDLALVERS